ncbi:39S ribosomal protein L21 mitochondrial [Dissostichus eleginoides]|uniref:Large ribosomal subunit protein bL21m n=1 Tax=Dissostichus eleginoides TaxID=100907 RepID=A0AAD9BQL8_DISEL|nr:39S ribosomal protein L21 mitochondrial [Dissostichus eleginoides]
MALCRGAGLLLRTLLPGNPLLFPAACRTQSSVSGVLVPRTSLTSPPWPEQLPPVCEVEDARRQAAVVSTVNGSIERQDYGRLFAVVHFASRQWKVTERT